MSNISLNANDFMAITRAMDGNKNNRIDNYETAVTPSAHRAIGNSNGVAGTRETATALEKGDVYVTSFKRDAADKIAVYSAHDT